MGSERWGRRAGRQRRGGQRATGDWRGRGEKGSERESAEGEGVDTRARARARDALKRRNIIPQRGLPHLASILSSKSQQEEPVKKPNVPSNSNKKAEPQT